MLSYKNVITPRQWQATTGLSESKFWKLCEVFGQTYEEIHSVNLVQTSKNLKRKLLLPTYADCLYFVLFQLKNGLSFDTLGVLIETDDSNSKRNFEKYLSVLGHSLTKLGMLPKRNFETVEELETYLGNVGTI